MARQSWNPENYDKNARFVSDLAGPVLDLLAPKSGERILDLGCGDGVLTAHLAALGCKITGVDASPAMVEAAKKRGVDVRVMGGEELSFENEFDAVFSNAALHWMKRSERVIAGVHRALKTGGRFAGEMGGAGNVAAIVRALHEGMKARGIDPDAIYPWYFPSDQEYRQLLEKQGFRVTEIGLHPRPTPLPGDITGWLTTFANAYLAALPPEQHETFLAETRERLRPHLYKNGAWTADYVRLRFRAEKAA
ncbi:MAG TPA: methyltransferase domain-containing protein [Alphaproteobacteria bacterium]|nr:methyltransferase domain-containing protein [Alphaproteobacteria bacterium]